MHPQPRQHPDLRAARRGIASVALAVLVVQMLGLQLLCFCGECALSHALGIGQPASEAAAHGCCHDEAEADGDAGDQETVVAAKACGCGVQHGGAQLLARLCDSAEEPVVSRNSEPLATILPELPGHEPPPAVAVARLCTRGPPPGPPPVLWLALESLLI